MPRASFPEGKAGYLSWRKSLYVKQAARAKELLAVGLQDTSRDGAARTAAMLARDEGDEEGGEGMFRMAVRGK